MYDKSSVSALIHVLKCFPLNQAWWIVITWRRFFRRLH